MNMGQVVIPKVWRSEIPRLLVFALTAAGSVILTRQFPKSIITGELFSLGNSSIYLSLPLFWLVPAGVLGNAILRIYNVRYILDDRGLESRVGIVSLKQSITRIRFEDIRSIETDQTLFERIIDVGKVLMGTAASGGIEMTFEGVASPQEVQKIIQLECDARQSQNRSSLVTSDEQPAINM